MDVPADIPNIGLACYQGMGACVPGEGECGVNGGCDFSGTDFQCFSNPPATAALGEACSTTNGPACQDGLTCNIMTATCAALCCDDAGCGTDEKCQATGVGHSFCVPKGNPPTNLLCYDGLGACNPGNGDCAGGHCDFANVSLGWQCFSSPPSTAQLGEACNKTNGPDCVDGLTCSILTNTCAALCCPNTGCANNNEVCVEMATGQLWICQEELVNPGNGLQCYAGQGTCIPGADQCGTNGQCDWGNASIGMMCFTSPPATATLGQSCNINSGPACKDGLTCNPNTGKCIEICCTNTDCSAGTCIAVDGNFKVCQ
ncbi:MAG: hypothetical protein CO108_29085 [Deltaproteobacteria bacterium CG_4_9_14_3_um_filter_63_12]|nr:MAG: hypothetical protein CO108_29085 [Deltaproteobacteria bacterium CG_4_9_14_3_um_filter_63_12]